MLGFRSPKTPCAATIHNLLKRLDALTKWVFSKLEDFQVLKTQHLEGVAIDGKELCGPKTQRPVSEHIYSPLCFMS